MEKLIQYIRDTFKSESERDNFCRKCGTSWAYIKKVKWTKQLLRENVCINFERESHAFVTVEELRPDVDWAVVRTPVIATK